jgi:hypothetical protein
MRDGEAAGRERSNKASARTVYHMSGLRLNMSRQISSTQTGVAKMLGNLVSVQSPALRRAALAGVVALSVAAANVSAVAPAAAAHGPMFMPHAGMGMHHDFGMRHDFDHRMGFVMRRDFDRDHDFDFDHHFRHHFHDRFAFLGLGFAPSYGYDDTCWRRVWGRWGWHWIDVCQY